MQTECIEKVRSNAENAEQRIDFYKKEQEKLKQLIQSERAQWSTEKGQLQHDVDFLKKTTVAKEEHERVTAQNAELSGLVAELKMENASLETEHSTKKA